MGTNGKEGYSSRRQQRRTLRRIMAMLGCMVAVVTCAALMAPAISMTAQTAQDQAGARLSVQEAEGAGADGAAEEPSAGDDQSGKAAAKAEDGKSAGESDGSRAGDGDGSVAGDDGSSGAAPDDGEPSADNAADGVGAAEDVSDGSENGKGTDAEEVDVEGDPADKPAASESAAAQEPDGSQRFADELKDVTGKVTLSVDVEAPAGALPEGATMRLAPVKRAKVEDAVGGAMAEAAARVAEGTAERGAEFVAAERAGAKVQSIQAVDIAFLDADGAEVEPASPITVKLAGPQIKKHVEGEGARSAEGVAEAAGVARDVAARPMLVHVADDGHADMVDVLGKQDLKARDLPAAAKDELVFEAGAFSVYAIVYTVDFEYSSDVDGKTYEYSIKGGDGISLGQLLPILGVIEDDKETTEVNEVQEFIDQIEDVQFSDPSLINVSKAEESTTVGEIKERLGLICENSADLTEDDLKEIDSKEISEGDWALISLKAFDSQESLTIAMYDGSVFTIDVTDANKTGTPDSGFFVNESGYIIYTELEGVIYVMDTEGVPWRVDDPSMLDTMGVEYKWRFEYVYKEQSTGVNYYKVHPFNDNSKTIALNWSDQALVQTGTNQISIVPDGNGYVFEGYNGTKLANYDGWFAGARNGDYCRIMIYEQEHPETYNFTVATANSEMGTVSGQNTSGQNASGDSFESITNGSASNTKTNRYPITAVPKNKYPNNPKYIFDHWELDGNPLDKNTYRQTINANQLELKHNNSVLTAVFVDNPNYDVHDIPDEDKEGTPINKEELQAWLNDLKSKQVPLNVNGCKKTAEVHDYENRIYRVDLTSQASLSTFEGTIDLGFIIDVSASMKFPSKLNPIDGMSNVDIRNINNGSWEWRNGKYMWKYGNNYYDTGKNYYIISDEQGTSTVYLIKYRNNRWEYKDASAEDSKFSVLNADAVFKAKDYDNYDHYYHYQVYEDGDNGKTRKDYLESSLSGTMNELQEILGILSLASDSSKDPDVKVAWNTFKNFLPNGTGQIQHQFVTAKNGINLEYESSTYGGGTSTDIALLDAAGVKRSDVTNYDDYYSTSKYSDWYPQSGVSTSFSYVNNYTKGFQWENSATKYAVLITDGAPQRGGRNIDNKYVEDAAQKLKDRGVTLITVGLGMDNVKNGKVLLYDIADVGKNGDNLFYSAKSGDELQYVLLEIIKQIIKDATVQGDVTDTIDKAFYPVNKETGKPLENGQMIDLEGNLTTDSSAPHGTIKKNNDGTYTVDWTNQAFTVDGWHGTVYVKAKEDLLGGNAITTNEGDAVIESKTYTLPGQTQPIPLKNDPEALQTKIVSLTTPRVNVNELSFTHNDNEWTVYLGTEVDPKAELIKMYDNILVEEVVTNASDNDHDGLPDKTSSTGELRYPLAEAISDQREGFATGEPQTFFLKDLISKITNGSISDGSSLDWDTLIAEANKGDQNKGITIPYHEYGIEDNSNITIKLIKTVVNGETGIETSPHDTSVTGDEVEKYTLTVLYSPDYTVLPGGQGGQSQIDFQTGQYGTKYAGHGAGTEDSNNVHIINVFAKGLQITKKDEDYNESLTGAEFKLYKVKNGTTSEVSGLTKNGAVFTINPFIHETGATYYLQETKAPDGYILPEATIPVLLRLNDSYTQKPDGTPSTTKPADNVIYDWTQTATLTLGQDYNRAVDAEGQPIGHAETDSENALVYYQIMNNPGVELPYTGGPGTTPIYLFGIALTGLAGAGLAMKRRRRNAA